MNNTATQLGDGSTAINDNADFVEFRPKILQEANAVEQRRIVYTKTSCYFCNEWLDGDCFKVWWAS